MNLMSILQRSFEKSLFRYLVYGIAFTSLLFFRMELDRNGFFITSDGQIKFYQTLQFASGDFHRSQCLYPGKDFDPNYEFYIFDYPWAFFGQNGMECAFQYPPFFPALATLFFRIGGERLVALLPLVFLFLSALVFDRILTLISITAGLRLLVTVHVFFLSFLSLSALDFAELSANDLLFLGGLYFLLHTLVGTKTRLSGSEAKLGHFFGFGVCAVFSILLRPETVLPYLVLAAILVLTRLDMVRLFFRLRNLVWIGMGGLMSVSVFLTGNSLVSGNPLGFRATNTGSDMESMYRIAAIWENMVSDLWKSDFKIGLFFAIPGVFMFFLPMALYAYKRTLTIPKSPDTPLLKSSSPPPEDTIGEFNSDTKDLGFILFLSGFIAILLVPVLSPYRAGYHHFGNRYFETSVILCFLGGAGIWTLVQNSLPTVNWASPKTLKTALVFLFIIASFYTFRYTKEGFKVMRASSDWFWEMHSSISQWDERRETAANPTTDGGKVSPRVALPIVHKSLFTNYLVGPGFAQRKHFLVTSPEEQSKLEMIFLAKGIDSYIELEFLGEPPYMSDIPRDLFERKIKVRYPSPNEHFSRSDSSQILEFQLTERVRLDNTNKLR